MSEANVGEVTAETTAGDSQAQQPAEQTVKYEDYQRVLADAKKYKEAAKAKDKALQDLESRTLKEKEDYKTLYERALQSEQEKDAKLKKVTESIIFNAKFNAAREAVVKLGLRDESDLKYLDLNELECESTSEGRLLVHGAESLAEKLKKGKPHWFKSGESVVINSGGSNTTAVNQELTASYMLELEKKDRKKYIELLPRFAAQQKK